VSVTLRNTTVVLGLWYYETRPEIGNVIFCFSSFVRYDDVTVAHNERIILKINRKIADFL
jgi:hypothetical protein